MSPVPEIVFAPNKISPAKVTTPEATVITSVSVNTPIVPGVANTISEVPAAVILPPKIVEPSW